MLKKEFEIFLSNLSTEELEKKINNNDFSGNEMLEAKRELRFRSELDESSIKNETYKHRTPKKPRLFGYELYNYKPILGVMLVVLPILLFMIYQDFIYSSKPSYYNELDKSHKAKLVNLKTNTITSQGFEGATESIRDYDISYRYNVNGVTYDNKITLPPNVENKNLIRTIRFKNSNNDSIDIRYNSYYPNESYLDY